MSKENHSGFSINIGETVLNFKLLNLDVKPVFDMNDILIVAQTDPVGPVCSVYQEKMESDNPYNSLRQRLIAASDISEKLDKNTGWISKGFVIKYVDEIKVEAVDSENNTYSVNIGDNGTIYLVDETVHLKDLNRGI